MAGLKEMYGKIESKSGLSEEIIRRILRATKEAVVEELRQGKTVTVPSIVTFTPVSKSRINIGGDSLTQYIKIKAKPSNALESELSHGSSCSINSDNLDADIEDINKQAMERLNFSEQVILTSGNKIARGVDVAQIDSLL